MEQIKKENNVHTRNLETISAFLPRMQDKEQSELFGGVAAESMEHRERLFDYIKAHAEPTMLYREKGQVDGSEKEPKPTVTPMKQAKRRNDNLTSPATDMYEYFTDRGGMHGDTTMANKTSRLKGMSFLMAHTARGQSPYQKRSSETKTQLLIRNADAAEQMVRDQEEPGKQVAEDERAQMIANGEKLAGDATQPYRSELSQLVHRARTIQQADEASDVTKAPEEEQDLESSERLAHRYLTRQKRKEGFLNLGNMVYERDHDKVNRLTSEDFAIETGKAIALLVLEHSGSEDKTLAKILSINEAQKQAEDNLPPDDNTGEKDDIGGGNPE